MSAPVAGTAAERIRAALAAAPGAVLEEIARHEGASYRAVLEALPPGEARLRQGADFETVWAGLTQWPGEVTFIVHTRVGVFETRGRIPAGSFGRGYFNVHGDSPFGGHIRAERCAAIAFVDRSLMGRRSCSVQFVSRDGDAMFKIFVGRGPDRELDPAQLALFEMAARITSSTSSSDADG